MRSKDPDAEPSLLVWRADRLAAYAESRPTHRGRVLPTANAGYPVSLLGGQRSGGEIARPDAAGRPFSDTRIPEFDARKRSLRSRVNRATTAHRQLVIHCDIKPSNVIVGHDGRALLLDFGIAQLTGQSDDASPAMTPGYASPEQTAGGLPGIASDVYSLGRLLRELLRPVAGRHRRAAELAVIVARATAQEVDSRYDSVGALRRDLHRLLENRPGAAMNGGAACVLSKGPRRQWPWALAGTLAVVLMATVTAQLVRECERTVMAERAALQRLSRPRQAPTPP